MPFVIGLSVVCFFTIAIFQYFNISISSEIVSSILTFSPILGLIYIVAGWFLGSVVRIASGVSLVSLGSLELGIPETISSWLQLAIVLIGALTPI
jgi:hypothetical protein